MINKRVGKKLVNEQPNTEIDLDKLYFLSLVAEFKKVTEGKTLM